MSDNATAAPAANTVAASSGGGFHPDRIVPRPRPAPKAAIVDVPSLPAKGRSAARKKTRSADADAARRQKTMTALVGILSVVFIGVMVVSLGGIGQSGAAPVKKDEAVAEPKISRFDPESWVFPEPLPSQMRNPLVIPKPQTLPEDPLAVVNTPMLAVRGIVYSDTKPTAIIGDQVAVEGQTLYGTTVVKISRDSVEFEKDGKRWIQHVQ